mmetsp:Transcript_44543/g.123363  ORF Transcript_44543/g.123363 Transcript_44543/m.123363 type:complete len:109 (+) Transcript_44543:78-404(+)
MLCHMHIDIHRAMTSRMEDRQSDQKIVSPAETQNVVVKAVVAYMAKYIAANACMFPSSKPTRWQSTARFRHEGADHCMMSTARSSLSSGQKVLPNVWNSCKACSVLPL